jgi:hypothetical protein
MTNYCFRARWSYVDASGNPLQQYAEQQADFIAANGPDPVSLSTAINNNFPTPAGATIVLLGISSSQTPAVYS